MYNIPIVKILCWNIYYFLCRELPYLYATMTTAMIIIIIVICIDYLVKINVYFYFNTIFIDDEDRQRDMHSYAHMPWNWLNSHTHTHKQQIQRSSFKLIINERFFFSQQLRRMCSNGKGNPKIPKNQSTVQEGEEHPQRIFNWNLTFLLSNILINLTKTIRWLIGHPTDWLPWLYLLVSLCCIVESW